MCEREKKKETNADPKIYDFIQKNEGSADLCFCLSFSLSNTHLPSFSKKMKVKISAVSGSKRKIRKTNRSHYFYFIFFLENDKRKEFYVSS